MAGSTSRDTFDGDVVIRKRLTVGAITLPADTVGNAQVISDDPIDVTKLVHQYVIPFVQGDSTTAAADQTRPVFIAFSPGVVYAIRAGVVDPCVGDSTISVDLYKNGSSILSSLIGLDSTQDAYDQSEGTIDDIDGDYLDGDVFELVIDVTVGTGTMGKGLFVQIVFREGSS